MTEVRNSSSYQYKKISRHVLGLIASGTLQPGDRLPSLRKMGATMKVSVPTVSQAYAELESEGVVEARERSGFFVARDYGSIPEPSLCEKAKPEAMDLSRPGLLRAAMDATFRSQKMPFGFAAPHESLLAGRCLGKVMRRILREQPQQSALICDTPGYPELRKQIALRCMDAGAVVSPDEVMITSGVMEGIQIMLRFLTRPGDAVLIQSPVFIIYLKLLELMGLRPIEIPSCPSGGISSKKTAEAIRDYDVKACIFVTNFPLDGSLTPDCNKKKIVKVLAEKNIPLIEDDVFGEFYFDGSRPTLCRSFDEHGLVITASSFAKTIAPGYRVGWLMPGKYMKEAQKTKDMMYLLPSTPAQMALAEFMRLGEYERHLRKLRADMAHYMGKLHCKISRYFPEGTCAKKPDGGISMWVKLPENVDSKELFFKAKELGIPVKPGSILSYADTFRNYIRLGCRGLWTPEVEEAVETLGRVVTDMARR